MVADIEAGKVNCVITKDLSRLGRNYIESGSYIEIFFPRHGVRYIAINDNVDSLNKQEMVITPFRNILNDMFSRDISKKVLAGRMARSRQGKFGGGPAPYEYIADPNDRNHLLPDSETAHVVKRIFAVYIRGNRMCEIQNWLRDNQILTIGELRYRRSRCTRHPRPTKDNEVDLFSGLMFCGDCGYKMYLAKGTGTLERKHSYTCGNYRNRARSNFTCTTHYIRKSMLKELVLADLQRVMSYVKDNEKEFIHTANEYGDMVTKKALATQSKELDKSENRINELNVLFRKGTTK